MEACTPSAKCSLSFTSILSHQAWQNFVPWVALIAPEIVVIDDLGAVFTKSIIAMYVHPERIGAISHFSAAWPNIDFLAFLPGLLGDVNDRRQLGRFGTSTIT